MSLLGRIQKFAKSPQGKKLMKQAEDVAKDPKTKQKINDVRDRLQHKDKPADATPKPPTPSGTSANPPSDAGTASAPPPGASS